jgi:hypothetical protein
MREVTVTLPVISLIAVTRGMLGAGLALLLGDRLDGKQRKAAGWTLLLVGAATTVPLALEVMGRRRRPKYRGMKRNWTMRR